MIKYRVRTIGSNISVTTIARWPKAWRVDHSVDECVYVREGRPRDPLNHNIASLLPGRANLSRWSRPSMVLSYLGGPGRVLVPPLAIPDIIQHTFLT